MRKKRQSSQQCHLALLGPTSVKAARKKGIRLDFFEQTEENFSVFRKKCSILVREPFLHK